MRLNLFSTILVFVLAAVSQSVLAQTTSPRGGNSYDNKALPVASDVMPSELSGVDIEEKLGETIDLSMPVTNEAGNTVTLGSLFQDNKPVLLSPIYYNCPGLCSFHFNGVIESLQKIDWNPGEKFQVIAFSFDAQETPDLAAKKKINYMKMYNRPGTEGGFHFLTADQSVVDKLMAQVGFRFKWNEKAQEWSHASAAIMISPLGKVTRYLHGVEFNPQDMKFALNETASGKIGNIVDSILLYCYQFDQHQSRYGLQVFRVMQIAGGITVLILAVWLVPVFFRARREKV